MIKKAINKILNHSLKLIDIVIFIYLIMLVINYFVLNGNFKRFEKYYFNKDNPQWQTDFAKENVKRIDSRMDGNISKMEGFINGALIGGRVAISKRKKKEKVKKN